VSRERERDESGHFTGSILKTGRETCRRCGSDITHLRQRRDRQWCSKLCAIYYRREQRRIEARLKRPRCAICSNPLPYGKNGFNLRAVTCSMACHVKFTNWFQRGARAS
jgi:hypothetical protein